ncbi:hypothetical protein RF11_10320 [Thelohanellus kitauei]|uniref:Uncharacterized protein n=1 Tax=Thelohanellus kitauei TaxID=669202 RepID=A0A0C2N8S9_THEKT|nr:hypothetical protein RF11_10320 [Thelohanellus kitauei]
MFDVINQHLYFIQHSSLVHTDLKKSRRLNRVSYVDFTMAHQLNIQTDYYSDIQHQLGSIKCNFECDPLIRSKSICYCVDEVKAIDDYMCATNDFECLNFLCVGFACNNGRCLLNNVRCDSINDCGDASDEVRCTSPDKPYRHPATTIPDALTFVRQDNPIIRYV